MTIAACATTPGLRVSKSIVGDPLAGGGNSDHSTQSDGDHVTFAIAVENLGGASINVDITDTFDTVFATPTWTRTGPTGTVTTGSGNITESNVAIGAGLRITYLVEVVYTPTACTSLSVNVVKADLHGDASCCDEDAAYAWAKVTNSSGPRVKLDPTGGWQAMEVLYYLLEGPVSLPDKVKIANFINACGSLGSLLGGEGGVGDGVATEILDTFGGHTGLFAETSAGF